MQSKNLGALGSLLRVLGAIGMAGSALNLIVNATLLSMANRNAAVFYVDLNSIDYLLLAGTTLGKAVGAIALLGTTFSMAYVSSVVGALGKALRQFPAVSIEIAKSFQSLAKAILVLIVVNAISISMFFVALGAAGKGISIDFAGGGFLWAAIALVGVRAASQVLSSAAQAIDENRGFI